MCYWETYVNLSRYDDLLNKRNGTPDLPSPWTKLREECLELALAIEHYQQGREETWKLAEEISDVFLVARGVILAEGEEFLVMVNNGMEFKAKRLLERLLMGESS